MTLQETLRALPPDEKLAIATALWDDLAASAPLVLPPDELAEMKKSRHEMLLDPGIAIAADEVGGGSMEIERGGERWLPRAKNNSAKHVNIEVTCSDQAAYRLCIESRRSDISEFRLPTWHDVVRREYYTWSAVESSSIPLPIRQMNCLRC